MRAGWMAVVGGVMATCIAGSVYASVATPVQSARQEHFKHIGEAAKAARDELVKPSPSIAVLKTSSKTLNELAAELPSWFPAGSGVGGKTAALPSIWEKPGDFKSADDRFVLAARAFDTAVNAGEIKAARAAAQEVGAACKGCHERFRARDER